MIDADILDAVENEEGLTRDEQRELAAQLQQLRDAGEVLYLDTDTYGPLT